ncbi:MAG: hypothetical protein NZ741_02765, partial [Armatimonadetes bacterium]|nr:hypothetical protein [Armatimonadota bacterium]
RLSMTILESRAPWRPFLRAVSVGGSRSVTRLRRRQNAPPQAVSGGSRSIATIPDGLSGGLALYAFLSP